MEDKSCKDCLQIENLKNKLEGFERGLKDSEGKGYDMILKLQDRVGKLERQGDKNEERVSMIFNILNEIKDSVKIIADKIDNFERDPPGSETVVVLKDDIKELSARIKVLEEKPAKKWDETTKTIILVLVTQIAIFIISKILK
ncbi:hypothetical protein AGR56_04085 [Clostridium sp. DMHC 10]|uniref:hypothetical protein n=1 Tax=Clostridium sp. DMHC 10 TaxID=747377 RepID=UPI00069D2827|nr:hypothetical protein [Clostridium sp. DMHC 10]KOF56110.1 hypothetical protein AGR56_04085 [Clostridium sp. DMHC 10]